MSARWLVALLALASLALGSPARAAVQVETRVARRSLTVGESTTLEVVVRGANHGTISDPELNMPAGLDVLGSGRQQNFSWVNGRSTSETVFRYEIGPSVAGRFRIGPFRVRVNGEAYDSPAIEVEGSAAPTQLGGGSQGPVSLVSDVSPRDPYVGQPVLLRVRLIQRAPLAEDPQYTPPATPGFWAEHWSDPESYYAEQGRQRVLVTETRARLYPLSQGGATIGEATATVVLASSGPGTTPLPFFGGTFQRREMTLHSPAISVRVRPLPPGAPASFDGAIGALTLAWSADRARTSQDVPVTVRFEVRGVGDLPLLHTPGLSPPDFEAFPGAVDDSLGAPGALGSGRRRFQWTLLPHGQGRLAIEAPEFAWYDPGAGAYRRAELPPIALQVDPPLTGGGATAESFPRVFAAHPVDPLSRGATPWAFGLAGLALGTAIVLWRASRRPPVDSADRAQQREWLRAVGRAAGSDFWRAADQASAWLESRGRPVLGLKRQISAARYGGDATDSEGARRRLVEDLARALPPASPAWPFALGAAVLATSALTLAVLLGPQPGPVSDRLAARAADAAARGGDVERARLEWRALWEHGARDPGLAARLAWAEIRSGAVGPAAAWVVRGERGEPRDAALGWVADRVREAGGLGGDAHPRWPVRRIEWAIAALLLGTAAGAAWPRRAIALPAAALAVAFALVSPLEDWRGSHTPVAVVAGTLKLEGPDLELAPGQVVTVRRRAGARAWVAAGRDIEGWLPVDGLLWPGAQP